MYKLLTVTLTITEFLIKKELLTDVAVLTHRAKGLPDLAGSQSSRSKLKIDGPAL